MKKKILIICLILNLVLLGGCSMFDKTITVEDLADIVADGVVDIEKAESLGFVPYEQATNGLENRSSNPQAEKYVQKNYDEIVTIVKPYVEEQLGREVEIYTIGTPFPYMAATVYYRTLEFPRIRGGVSIGLEDSFYFSKNGIKKIETADIMMDLIPELYEYAYKEELDQMRNDFSEAFPSLMPRLQESEDALNHGAWYPYIMVTYESVTGEGHKEYKDELYKICEAYEHNPNLTQEELKKMFNDMNPYTYKLNFRFQLIMKDEHELPTQQLWTEVRDYIDEYDKFWATKQDTTEKAVGEIETNYRTTKAIKNHDSVHAIGVVRDNYKREVNE